uniref:Scarecrow-like transcription factor 11 (SCL11) n=1 Tax=Zea mays TaxID=4577 RepID=A0A804N028_MAIZE
MAAKREISSTLRNLKFMQRGAAAQKAEEKAEVEVQEEEVVMAPSGGFASSAQVVRKCIVIMEGNPHPGAIKGRMSFQNFNPSIDMCRN